MGPATIDFTSNQKIMNPFTDPSQTLLRPLASMLAALLLGGCVSADRNGCANKTASAMPAPLSAPVAALSTIRINAGADASYTDSGGNVWLADRGFVGGDVVVRPADTEIFDTKDGALYRTEHWGMDSFLQPLPNGKYVVKLHFAETSPNVQGPGDRLFSFNVEGREFREFDVWKKAGGPRRACVETVNVVITDGELEITFEAIADSPEINAIEIFPAP